MTPTDSRSSPTEPGRPAVSLLQALALVAALVAAAAALPPLDGRGVAEAAPRPPVPPGDGIRVIATARDGRLWVGGEALGLRPFFVKGVNFGVALPGRFPAEFPEEEATYASWFEAMSDLGANTVRVYTVLPPAFYSALDRHNRRAGAAGLWLVQGVWAELPEKNDFDAPGYVQDLREEIRRAVDAVHGNLDQPPRRGHASGTYGSDVSGRVLAYLLGREWEPLPVMAYEARAGAGPRRSFRGTYFVAEEAAPFEIWLGRLLDFTVAYETERYRQQRPVAFVSWPTLDPIAHPTEPTVEEERALLRRQGDGEAAARMHDFRECEDCVAVDAARIRPTPLARGGTCAAYHAYPYYPDFMILDPGYGRARDSMGPSNYIGYLLDLKRHHGDQPVLIAEVGVPSSRGIAHFQPQGWHHGGHTEKAQGEIDARLMGDIREAGLAGGILFALLDEWFKRSWLVAGFEVPHERNPLWLNPLDPEQNYGVLAARPGKEGWRIVVDGRPGDWAGIPPLAEKRRGGPEWPLGDPHDAARTLRGLSAASDEAYLYLRLDVADLDADRDGAVDWGEAAYLIGIDTYDGRLGDHLLPVAGGVRSPAGLEFCVVLDGQETGRLLVDEPYNAHATQRRPYGSVENADGRFAEIRVAPHRRRVARDGTVFPARTHNRSPLLHASMDRRDADHSSLADWRSSPSGDFIEMRLAWGLLNVTDPSSRRVLHDDSSGGSPVGTVETPGFRFYVAAVKPAGPPGGATPIAGLLADRLPAGDELTAADLPLYGWDGWDRPSFRIEKKEGWSAIKRALQAIPSHPGAP